MEGKLTFNQQMEGSIPPSPANRKRPQYVDGLFFNGEWWYCMYSNLKWYRTKDNTGGYHFWQLDEVVPT